MEVYIFSIYLFLCFTVLFGVLTVVVPSIFATSVISGLFSLSCAVLYFFLNSPDVGMTEASVGVFLSTGFCIMTIRITKNYIAKKQSNIRFLASSIVFVSLLPFLYKAVKTLGKFGEIPNVIEASGGMHLLLSYKDFKIPNVITTVLGSFRGFDTMGETIIIFTSAIGVFVILKLTKNAKFTSLQ
jgi:multicomponent Na+:H+ antiporter subunit B